MKYYLANTIQQAQAKNAFNLLIHKKAVAEIKEVKQTRSTRQNSALHLYFVFIADALNELCLEFQYKGVTGKDLSLRYTPELVKEFVWRPIQIALFNVKSTTKIDTHQINQIIDILTKFFAEKKVEIQFPNIETLMNHEE